MIMSNDIRNTMAGIKPPEFTDLWFHLMVSDQFIYLRYASLNQIHNLIKIRSLIALGFVMLRTGATKDRILIRLSNSQLQLWMSDLLLNTTFSARYRSWREQVIYNTDTLFKFRANSFCSFSFLLRTQRRNNKYQFWLNSLWFEPTIYRNRDEDGNHYAPPIRFNFSGHGTDCILIRRCKYV